MSTMNRIENKTHLIDTRNTLSNILNGEILMLSIIGSRNLGIHDPVTSDYDYVCVYNSSYIPGRAVQVRVHTSEITLISTAMLEVFALSPYVAPAFYSSYKYCDDKFLTAIELSKSYMKDNAHTMYNMLISQIESDYSVPYKKSYNSARDSLQFLEYQKSGYNKYDSIMDSEQHLNLLRTMKENEMSEEEALHLKNELFLKISKPEYSEIDKNHPFLLECTKLLDSATI